MADPEQRLVSSSIDAVVSGIDAVVMCAPFFFLGVHVLTERLISELGHAIPSLVSAVRSSHRLSQPTKIHF